MLGILQTAIPAFILFLLAGIVSFIMVPPISLFARLFVPSRIRWVVRLGAAVALPVAVLIWRPWVEATHGWRAVLTDLLWQPWLEYLSAQTALIVTILGLAWGIYMASLAAAETPPPGEAGPELPRAHLWVPWTGEEGQEYLVVAGTGVPTEQIGWCGARRPHPEEWWDFVLTKMGWLRQGPWTIGKSGVPECEVLPESLPCPDCFRAEVARRQEAAAAEGDDE